MTDTPDKLEAIKARQKLVGDAVWDNRGFKATNYGEFILVGVPVDPLVRNISEVRIALNELTADRDWLIAEVERLWEEIVQTEETRDWDHFHAERGRRGDPQ